MLLHPFPAAISKLPPVPARPPQKVKATVANIPVGCYDGGGRGKEREKDREKEREREKEKESSSCFSFEVDKSGEATPAAPTLQDDGTSEAEAHNIGEAGSTTARSKEASAKEVTTSSFLFHLIRLNTNLKKKKREIMLHFK